MLASFLRGIHHRLKSTPGLRWLDALIITFCVKLAVPFWLKMCRCLLWLRLLRIATVEQKRLVVVSRYGGIGDVICTFPAVAELVRQNPAHLVVYVVRRSLKTLVERSGLDVRVVGVRNHLELPSKPTRIFKQSTYLAYPGEDSAVSHVPGRLTDGFARCLGFQRATGTPTLRVDRAKADTLRAEYLRHLGETERRAPALRKSVVTPGGGSALPQPLVLLHAGPTWAVKEWPIESWRRLVEKLKSELGCAILQLVAARNITVINPVCRVVPGAEPVHCKDDIDKLIHLVAAADLLVGIDSGPIHVAGAVGTPFVALFGPTDPSLIFSNPELATEVFHRVECSFCHHSHPRLHWMSGCPHDIKCMKELTVEQVFDAVAARLSEPACKS